MKTALVIGAGPAGLMAAGELARAGVKVTVAEAKPSPARKFLMAGKSGLNLTKDEPLGAFLENYSGNRRICDLVAEFGPEAVQDWARALGQEVFTGSSGRVFPAAMKASPLLRAWLAELDALGVMLRTCWRWAGWSGEGLVFDTLEGRRCITPDATVLALGGQAGRGWDRTRPGCHFWPRSRSASHHFNPATPGCWCIGRTIWKNTSAARSNLLG